MNTTSSYLSESQPPLRIFTLGQAQIYRGERLITPLDWGDAKPKELLFYLLCHPACPKEQIGLTLWPDARPTQQQRSFQVTLHDLRRVLGGVEWIIFENGGYTFNRSLNYWFDLETFEMSLAEAQQRRLAREPAQAIAYLDEAVNLYQGDFLKTLEESEWYLPRREELRRRYLEALLTLGQLLFNAGHYPQASSTYRRALIHDLFCETAHYELMRCYARLGERTQALHHYQTLVTLLHDALGSAPAPETSALMERLRRGEEI